MVTDKQQLIPTLAAVSLVIPQVTNVLVDSGYYSKKVVLTVESGPQPTTIYTAMNRQSHGHTIAQLEVQEDPPPLPPNAIAPEQMVNRLGTTGKQLYRLRKQTVEPVFGIIKQAPGFRRFLLCGQEKVRLE